ncbi:MAG: ADP-forming succinate--CoA ligase subunit beta, partial [Oscillospiraceae bacterium]
PKSLLIVLIGGFNRMDDMANGITGYIRDYGLSIPVFTRMCGTMEEEGFAIMERGGLHAGRNLMETVAQAVESSREVRV